MNGSEVAEAVTIEMSEGDLLQHSHVYAVSDRVGPSQSSGLLLLTMLVSGDDSLLLASFRRTIEVPCPFP